MSATRAGHGTPGAPAGARARMRRLSLLAVALGVALLAGVLLFGSGIALARSTGAQALGARAAATATAVAHTPTAAPTATPLPAPTPVTLTSNGLAIFTTLGCILGVIGLLAFGIAWITLLSDGWGPMLRALIVGNRKGRLRFARKPQNGRLSEPRPPRTPVAGGGRGGWR